MKNTKIAIIGLGYVGLPLAVEFAKYFAVIGFDKNQSRIANLKKGIDKTLEISKDSLSKVCDKSIKDIKNKGLWLTSKQEDLKQVNFYIVTVPTPVDKNNKPDLSSLYKASETVGKVLSKNDIVVYESTVYPGATEEECVPILIKYSNLVFNKDFFVGYSPERINPGDKKHTVSKILKVTSGSNPEIGKKVDAIYKTAITAGTHLAPSIKVAEASKVIENSQRDINIAFVNELSKIFSRLNIDTSEVLAAAATKWNFLNFKPGLVGGHCIGVDPYYLAEKAVNVGYNPEIILAGRRLNDGMGAYVAQETIKLMIAKDISINSAKILILGITFKENCPDIRNSKVIDIIDELQTFQCKISVYDPWADKIAVKKEYNLNLIEDIHKLESDYSAVILAVTHKEFLNIDISKLVKKNSVIFDVKGILHKSKSDKRL